MTSRKKNLIQRKMHLQVFADSDDSIRARGNYRQMQVQPLPAACAEVNNFVNGELFSWFHFSEKPSAFPPSAPPAYLFTHSIPTVRKCTRNPTFLSLGSRELFFEFS